MTGMEELTDDQTAGNRQEHLGELLRRVEGHHESAGWHMHAEMWMYLVFDHHDVVTAAAVAESVIGRGKVIRTGRYTAQAILEPGHFAAGIDAGDVSPHQALYRFVMNVAYGDLTGEPEFAINTMDRFRELLRMTGIIGFLVCYESYGQVNPVSGDLEQHAAGRPGSRECGHVQEVRSALMVDSDDRVHAAFRVRGEPAHLELDLTCFGFGVQVLRILMDAATGRLPDDQESFAARYTGLSQ